MGRVLLAVSIVLSCLLVMAPSARSATTGGPCSGGATCYYLAIGDSLAEGYQPNMDFAHGYADFLYTALKQKYPNIALEDLGCIAETTTTMLGQNGTYCPGWQYTTGMTTTPQITQTINFLQNHPNQVSLITLDIGANDALKELGSKPTIAELLNVFLPQFSSNLDEILSEVQAAAGPNVPIIIMTNYNPLVASSSSSLIALAGQVFSNTLTNVVTKNHPGVAIADVYNAFNKSANPKATICQLTWWCSSSHRGDPHANTLGYKFIAALFWQAGAQQV